MPPAGDDNFIREFQRRRTRMLRHFACSMVLIILALGFLQLSDLAAPFLALGLNQWRALAASQFAAAMVFAIIGFNQYRCPSCDELVRGHDIYYLGVVIDPEKCPHCGKRLK
ncbi:MAG: hypothetical protein WAW37_01340 [Syntrophobacteraceae bacterium]